MRQHDANGREIAKWLVEQVGARERVLHRLPTHPQYELASRQMSGFGGMISVELGTRERAAHVLEQGPSLFARRIAGRRGVADQPAGRNDPRLGSARTSRRDWAHRRARSALVRRRGRRGPAGRPGAGVRGDAGTRDAGAASGRETQWQRDTVAAARAAVRFRLAPPATLRPYALHSRTLPWPIASRSSRSRRARGSIPPIAPRSTRFARFPGSTKSFARSPDSSASAAFASCSSATR